MRPATSHSYQSSPNICKELKAGSCKRVRGKLSAQKPKFLFPSFPLVRPCLCRSVDQFEPLKFGWSYFFPPLFSSFNIFPHCYTPHLNNETSWLTLGSFHSGIVLEKVAEYFYYNYKNRNRDDVPDMDIPPELCLELLMAADFLDGMLPFSKTNWRLQLTMHPSMRPNCLKHTKALDEYKSYLVGNGMDGVWRT